MSRAVVDNFDVTGDLDIGEELYGTKMLVQFSENGPVTGDAYLYINGLRLWVAPRTGRITGVSVVYDINSMFDIQTLDLEIEGIDTTKVVSLTVPDSLPAVELAESATYARSDTETQFDAGDAIQIKMNTSGFLTWKDVRCTLEIIYD